MSEIKRNKAWDVMYETAIRPDGSLLFPERLTTEFLEEARKKMGSMLFANQYLNEIFPAEDAKFKLEWFRYTHLLPSNIIHFAFIDPAISTEDHADYTGIVVAAVDDKTNWYIRHASRTRLNPTQIVEKCFQIQKEFNCRVIGIEDVAYQKALLYMVNEKMMERQVILPVKGINKGNKVTKEMHIMSMIPLFEWGRLHFASKFDDLERELLQFPRGSHDDIADALASLQQIVYYPQPIKEDLSSVKHNPHDPRYESYIIRQYANRANQEG